MNKKLLIFVCVLASSLLVLGTVGFISNHIKMSGNFPENTYINNVDCSGLTVDEAGVKLTDEWNSRSFLIRDDGRTIASIDDLDFKYDIHDKLEKAIVHEAIDPLFTQTIRPRDGITLKMKISSESSSFRKQFDSLSILRQSNVKKTKNAYVDMSDTSFKIVPEVYGNDIDKDLLEDTIISDIENNEFTLNYSKKDYYKKPTVTSESASLIKKQDYCKKYLSFVIKYDFGDRTEIITPAELSKMISISSGTTHVDKDAVEKYVQRLAQKYNTVGSSRSFKCSDGDTVTVTGGTYGWILDQDSEVSWLVKALKKGKGTVREPEYSRKALSRKTNDIGNSYVEVDLGSQRLWMYKNGNLVLSCSVVTGTTSKGKGTPQGTYYLAYKARNRTLKGEDWDGTNYESDVSYWMPFNNGIGLHDASWRSTFGGTIYKKNGSHGCVNMPPASAKIVYKNIYAGYPIVVHY